MRVTVLLLLAAFLGLAMAFPFRRNSTDGSPGRRLGRFRGQWRNGTHERFRNWKQRQGESLRRRFQKLNATEQEELRERITETAKIRGSRFRPTGDSITQINLKNNASEDLYESDIALTDEQVESLLEIEPVSSDNESNITRVKRTAAVRSAKPWPGTIPYSLDKSLNAAAIASIRAAITFWQTYTCVRFQETTAGTNRLKFFADDGCYSYVGMIGGTQEVSIGRGCEYIDVTTHELGHALGLNHEQARFDRDNYVTINFNNVQAAYVDQFDKEPQSSINPYGEPFDISSVMQYDAYAFARDDSKLVVVTKDANYQFSLGYPTPSFRDLFVINNFYNCFTKSCGTTKVTCQNGGMQNPNSCSQCICPPGFGGATCADRQAGCGAAVTVSGAAITYTIPTLGNTNDGTVSNTLTTCNYMFKAAAGFTKVKVSITKLSGVCDENCIYAGLAIYSKSNARDAGYRFCCSSHKKTLTSAGSVLRVAAFRRVYSVGATLTVVAV